MPAEVGVPVTCYEIKAATDMAGDSDGRPHAANAGSSPPLGPKHDARKSWRDVRSPQIDLQELVSAAAGCRLRQPTEARYHDHGPLPGFSTGRPIQVLTVLAKPLPIHAARYMASSRAFALSLSSAVRADRRNPASRLDWRNVRRRQGRPSHADSELVYWRANTIATDRLVECCVRRTERSGRCG